jgi:predicted RNase H-like HicB family nuclease
MSPEDTFDPGASAVPSRGMTVRVLLYSGEDGYLVAECPELPGCASQGRTRDDALENVREAIEGWLDVESELGTARRTVEIVDVAV